VVGFAELIDSRGPLDINAWRAHRELHRIPTELDHAQQRWPFAWVLRGATPLATPEPYHHPKGAVIWVNLPDDAANQRGAALPPTPLIAAAALPLAVAKGEDRIKPTGKAVPFARDGTWFGPHLRRAGGFTIGESGAERTVVEYMDAVQVLRGMTVARWRRPNSAGNWGIVVGVEWRAV
jgi:hypothetical protein